MGRGRGKGKKQFAIAARDDTGSGEDEKLPVRRRGRPQKPMKDEIEEEDEVEKIEEEEEKDDDDDDDGERTKSSVSSKGSKNQTALENGRKRKRPSQTKESEDPITDENAMAVKTSASVLIKTAGYRQNGSRRKNKPRRAAEVGVESR